MSHFLDDYAQELFSEHSISVGSKKLKLKIPSFRYLSMLQSDYSESESFLSIYDALILLYVDDKHVVFEAFSKLVEDPLDDFSSYGDLVKEEIAHSTYKFLFETTCSNSYNFYNNFKSEFEKLSKSSDNNLEKSYSDMKIFLVKNFGYRYSEVEKLPVNDLLRIFINESVIHGDASMVSYIIGRLNSCSDDLSFLKNSEFNLFVKNVILTFQKLASDCYNDYDTFRQEMNSIFSNIKLPFDINGGPIEYVDGRIKNNFKAPGTMDVNEFLESLEK